MKPGGLQHARKALVKCERALQQIRSPDSDVADAWEDFLQAAAKVYEKLKAAAQGDAKSWAWFGKRLDERRDDDLLAYIHHARNAEFHGIADIVSQSAGITAISFENSPNDSVSIEHMVFRDGVMSIKLGEGEAPPVVRVQPPYIKLEGVWDRIPGTKERKFYPAPKAHLGRGLQTDSAAEIAELALSYLSAMVEEAESLRR